jgi:hypothetical protein
MRFTSRPRGCASVGRYEHARGKPTVNADHGSPVRRERARESIRLAEAGARGPFVAWRDTDDELRVQLLAAERPLTVGRSITHPVTLDFPEVSREHLEILWRVRDEPGDESVYLLDLASNGGTQHRRLLIENAAERPLGEWQGVPSPPARPLHLAPGEHDVWLARRTFIRIGGVREDLGVTHDEREPLPPPTSREHDVLVELCREQFERGTSVATATNAEIGPRLTPPLLAGTVSEKMSTMYKKYKLEGTKEQNRVNLANIALSRGLVGPEDYAC